MRIDFNEIEPPTITWHERRRGNHDCPQGSTHGIESTGDEELVLLAIVVKR